MVRVQRLPIIGDYFIKEIPPSDNVSFALPRACTRVGVADRMWDVAFLSVR